MTTVAVAGASGYAGGEILRAPHAVFGMASRKGLIFESHDPHGAMFMWVGVVCH